MGMFDHTPRALAWLRAEKGLQQKELSERSGVGRAAISRYESGKATPSLENLGRLLEALDVGPQDFAECLDRLREELDGIPAPGRRRTVRRRRVGRDPSAPARGAYVLLNLAGEVEEDSQRARNAVKMVARLLERQEGRG
jgi:transcriptional regulator with XRE-family HTH domain